MMEVSSLGRSIMDVVLFFMLCCDNRMCDTYSSYENEPLFIYTSKGNFGRHLHKFISLTHVCVKSK